LTGGGWGWYQAICYDLLVGAAHFFLNLNFKGPWSFTFEKTFTAT
jgi:hypothetical protein